ncbi:MAG: tetratricopeptide repeat protein, partial [Streptomyces sp.]|nr:tetratricopeptide repeat protein [Streptomyces sp.]
DDPPPPRAPVRLDRADGQGADAAGPQPPGPVFTVIPAPRHRTPRLHGREHETIVRTVLSPPPDQPAVHVLTGLGGSGKTRIAQEIATRAAATRRVWWIRESQISASMREVALLLGAPDGEVEAAFRGDRSSRELVWRYLEGSQEPWLLVFDNIDDARALGLGWDDDQDAGGWIRAPHTPRGRVIVTSRDLTADQWLPPCRVHHVLPLPDSDGAALLLEAVPDGGSKEDARRLSRELGGLPLALGAAAAYINSVRQSAFSLSQPPVAGFETYRLTVRARISAPPGTAGSRIDELLPDRSIMAEVCGIGLGLLAERGYPQAAPLLKVFACLGTAPIPYRLLLTSPELPGSPLFPDFPSDDRDEVLRQLAHLDLIEEVPQPSAAVFDLQRGLQLHPLVHALLRGDPDVRGRRADYYGLTVRVLLHIATEQPPDEPENWEVWEAILPHAVEVARSALDPGDRVGDVGVQTDALELARLTARYLIAGGPLLPAVELLEPLIEHSRAYGFAPDDREILGLRHELGRIYLEIGDLTTAETYLRDVVADRERVLGPRAAHTLASRHKYARSVLEQRDRAAEAVPLLRTVVKEELDLHGPEHPDTLTVRHSLARALFATGRAAAVEEELRDILAVSLRTRSRNTPETLRVRQTLARSLLEAGRHDEGLEEILQARADTPGPQDSILAMALRFTWCQALLLVGRIPQAQEETTRLLDNRTRVLGPQHAETVRTARLLEQIGRIPPGDGAGPAEPGPPAAGPAPGAARRRIAEAE